MSDHSKIEWTDASWNPIRALKNRAGETSIGWHCEKLSAACANCYAEKMNKRLGTKLSYKAPQHPSEIKIFLSEEILLQPLKWKRPRKIFVCSMTDLFGDWVRDEWIDKVFAIMALTPQHTFQILTKRPERERAYISNPQMPYRIARHVVDLAIDGTVDMYAYADADTWPVASEGDDIDMPENITLRRWPLPNVWLGVTAENQEMADKRIPDLLAPPAARRWVSIEPMLGPIDLESVDYATYLRHVLPDSDAGLHPLDPVIKYDVLRGHLKGPDDIGLPKLDWIVAGGESGKHARPSHPDWFRSLRDQCAAAGVPFLFKRWGEQLHDNQIGWWPYADDALKKCQRDGNFWRVGKRAAGRLLDGIEHNAFPEIPK
jgi:protein gp37